ncbi:MAG: hypothetical protein WAU70_13920 [Flavobacteriales bacterium]
MKISVHRALLALLVLLSCTALAGAGLLMVHPDGSLMGMSPGDFVATFFADFFWPGVIMFSVFGIGSAVVAVAVARRLVAGTTLAMVIGSGQLIRILAQIMMLKHLPGFKRTHSFSAFTERRRLLLRSARADHNCVVART